MKNLHVIKRTLLKASAGASLLLVNIFSVTEAKAQLYPLGAIYFQNQYLANPAMAGIEEGIRMDMAYRKQWSTLPGAPQTQSLTADYGSEKKVGLGLNIYNDEAGLLKRSRVMATYAYHLPLNQENEKLHFGLSLGIMDERIVNEKIIGSQNDATVGRFNQRKTYLDGDFGIAYTNDRLTLQGSLPNLKTYFNKDQQEGGTANRTGFFGAASYKFFLPNIIEGMGFEPKVVYRQIRGNKSLADIGTNISLADNIVNVMAFYHTSESATIGMGVKYKSLMQISGLYTTGTSALQGYTNGNFELNVKVNLKNKPKVQD